MDFWKQFSRATRYNILFFSFLIAFGGGCFFFARLGSSEQARQFVLGLGIALLPAGLIGLGHRLFFYDELTTEMNSILRSSLREVLEVDLLPFLKSGMVRVFKNRNEAIAHFSNYLVTESHEIIIIGSSLRGILDPAEEIRSKKEFSNLIRSRLNDGVSFKFLLTHPSLAFLREDAEGRADGDIKREIIETLHYLTRDNNNSGGLPGLGIPYHNIKLYKGTPTIFSIITSKSLLMNPYTYKSNAYENFCIEVLSVGANDLYSRFMSDHFHGTWNDGRTTEPLTKDLLERLTNVNLTDIFPKRAEDIGVFYPSYQSPAPPSQP